MERSHSRKMTSSPSRTVSGILPSLTSVAKPPDRADVREPQSLNAIVHGRVQGVGYRDFVARQARALGLTGWVRNLSDGRSVQVSANGPRQVLETLVDWLREGPRFAHVYDVEVEWSTTPDQAQGFEVRY